jgi:hypothetical protein
MAELIATVRADAETDDPLALLATASATIATLTETGDAVLGHFVDQCRLNGHSWTEISGSLGVTKQAAHKRFTFEPTLERFTARARAALDESGEAAMRLGHGYVGTEHMLLGLLVDPEGLAAKVLTELNVTAAGVEAAIVAHTPATDIHITTPPFTPLARDAVARTVREAIGLGHNYVGTEHILLALMDDSDGMAASILTSLGVTLEPVRARVVELLAGYVSTTKPKRAKKA